MAAADKARDGRRRPAAMSTARERPAFAWSWLILLATIALSSTGLTEDGVPSSSSGAARIQFLDGSSAVAALQSIGADGSLQARGLQREMRWDDVWRLERDSPSTTSPAGGKRDPGIVVEARRDARLHASDVTLGEDEVAVNWPLAAGKLTFSIDELKAIWFDRPAAVLARAPSLAKPSADLDRVVIETGGQSQILPGLITACSARTITLERDGREYEIERRGVLAIVMAAPPGDADEPPAAMVFTFDGSQLPVSAVTGDKLDQENGGWTFRTFAKQPVRLPSFAVRRVEARSSRLSLLSARTPSAAEHRTLVAEPLAWQRDRSVDGRALQVGGQTYAVGLGLQAGARVTFALDKPDQTLFATVGLNDRAAQRGDCQASVLGDRNEVLWTARVRGGDRPLAVRVALRDNRQLTLVVEPGENLDLGDHVDWCEARLVASR